MRYGTRGIVYRNEERALYMVQCQNCSWVMKNLKLDQALILGDYHIKGHQVIVWKTAKEEASFAAKGIEEADE